ncbi:hypothetical protein Tco_1457386 [Tanacetum coccineum]
MVSCSEYYPDWLRNQYECLASAPIACTARQMVFSSPWLTPEKESGSPLQTALVCFSNPLIALASPEQTATGKDVSNPLYGCDGLPKTVRVFQFTLDSCSEKLDWFLLHQDWKLLFFDVAASFDSAVHRVHAVSFDAAVASTVSAACWFYDAAAYFPLSAATYCRRQKRGCHRESPPETWLLSETAATKSTVVPKRYSRRCPNLFLFVLENTAVPAVQEYDE